MKIIIIGDSGTGKTSILKRYVKRTFDEDYKLTIGVDFMMKTIILDNNLIKLQIWDTAGLEKFKHVTHSYYRGAHAALICFDLTSRISFDSLNKWIKDYSNYQSDKRVYIIIGNKSDLIDEREVSEDEVLNFVKMNNSIYFETSAKKGNNIEEVFDYLVKLLFVKIEKTVPDKQIKLTSVSTSEDLAYKESECLC
jgi:small GTP-binding protein